MGDVTPASRILTRALLGVSALVSVVVSVYLTFDGEEFKGFLVSALWSSLILFAVLYVLGRAALSLVKRDVRRAGQFALAALAVCVATVLILLREGELTIRVPPAPHFRTNILTGRCEYIASRDPWYYNRGCSIPREEKIRMVKGSRYPGFIRGICSSCKDVANCPEIRPVPGEDISCADLLK